MGKFLPILICVLAASTVAYADNWSNCGVGTGPAVAVVGCYGAGAGSYPGTCPTGEWLAVDDLVAKVESDAPDGSSCYGGTIQGPAPSVNTDNQYGYYKKCVGAGGEDHGALGILGGKTCSADAACGFQVGDQIAAGAFGFATRPTEAYCVQHCQTMLKNFGLTFGPIADAQPYVAPYFEVSSLICTVTTPPPADLPPVQAGSRFCMNVSGQQVCASSEGALLMTVHDMRIETAPSGAVCGDGQCVESGEIVQTSHGTLALTGTPAPPAPTATPNLQLSPLGASGPTYSYWAPAAAGGDDDGEGGTPGSTCGGPDQQNCKVELAGDFTAPANDKTAPTFSEALNSFNTSIQSAPLLVAIGSVAGAIPTEGIPPGGDVTLEALGGVTLHMAPPQEVVDAIAPILGALSLCAWGLYAIFVILSS